MHILEDIIRIVQFTSTPWIWKKKTEVCLFGFFNSESHLLKITKKKLIDSHLQVLEALVKDHAGAALYKFIIYPREYVLDPFLCWMDIFKNKVHFWSNEQIDSTIL